MFNKPILSGLLLTVVLGFSLPSQAQGSGAELYQQHCSKCHGDDGKARTLRGWLFFAQNLSKATWQTNTSDEEILSAIQKGPGIMPSYANSLTDEEQQNLLKFVRSLKN